MSLTDLDKLVTDYFHIVRDYAHFRIEFPFYYGSEFCTEDSDRFNEVGLEFSFRNGWMKVSTIITEDTDLTEVFDVLFSVLKDYN